MVSAGLIPYRLVDELEILIAHPGGPFWARRDAGWWSIVKGRTEGDEAPREAAAREFAEETGWPVPDGTWLELGSIVQRSGKEVVGFAVEAPDLDPGRLQPGHFTMQWKGRSRSFPEIDRVRWAGRSEARRLLLASQIPFFDRIEEQVGGPRPRR